MARQRKHEHWQKNLILKADPELEKKYPFREEMFSPDEVRYYKDLKVKTYKHRDATGQDIYLYKRDRDDYFRMANDYTRLKQTEQVFNWRNTDESHIQRVHRYRKKKRKP